MSRNELTHDISQHVRTVQIIAAALMMGVATFGLIAFFIGLGREPGDPLLAYIAAGFAGLIIVAWGTIPSVVVNSQRAELAGSAGGRESIHTPETVRQLCGLFQTRKIIRDALLEGAAFFNLLVYIIAVQWWSLLVAALLLAVMAATFPTWGRVETWIWEQLRLMEAEQP